VLAGAGGTEGIAVGVKPAAIGEPQVPQNREWTAVRCPEDSASVTWRHSY